MKTKTALIFIVFSLLCYTSCQREKMEFNEPICIEKLDVQHLIQQARNGEVEAYQSLAFCYRDGNGVKQSYLNAIFMYYTYINKKGYDLSAFDKFFDEKDPYRLLVEILNATDFDEKVQAQLVKLKETIPAEAKCIEAMKTLFVDGNTDNVLVTLEEAETEGSELAGIMQAYYFMEIKKDTTAYQQCLFRLAVKHPFLNAKIAELYEMRYEEDHDFSNIHQAIEHYYKADSYGMLSPRNANKLWSAYSYYGQKGMLEYDENEIERIKKIVKTERY